jgi:hypothetical protein
MNVTFMGTQITNIVVTDLTLSGENIKITNFECTGTLNVPGALTAGTGRHTIVNGNVLDLGTFETIETSISNLEITGTGPYTLSLARCAIKDIHFTGDAPVTLTQLVTLENANHIVGFQCQNELNLGTFIDATRRGWFANTMVGWLTNLFGGVSRDIIFESTAQNNSIFGLSMGGGGRVIFRNTAAMPFNFEPIGNEFVACNLSTLRSEIAGFGDPVGTSFMGCVVQDTDETAGTFNSLRFSDCWMSPAPITSVGDDWQWTSCTFATAFTMGGSGHQCVNCNTDDGAGATLNITGSDILVSNFQGLAPGGTHALGGSDNQITNCSFITPVTVTGTGHQFNNNRFQSTVTVPAASTGTNWTGNRFPAGGAGVTITAGSAPLMVGNLNLVGAAGYPANLANAVAEGIAPTNT